MAFQIGCHNGVDDGGLPADEDANFATLIDEKASQ